MMRLAGPVTHVGYVKFAYKGVVVETTGRGGGVAGDDRMILRWIVLWIVNWWLF